MHHFVLRAGGMGRAGFAFAAMLATVAMWAATTAMAQSAAPKPGNMAKDADPGWEAVTVKPSDPNDKFDMMTTRGRHVVIRNKSVEAMLRLAYGVQSSQIVGAPEWTRTDRFDIDGVPDVDGQPNMKQYQALVQKVLAERF